MEKLDCVVVGAGALGLAVAREFSLRGREVLVLEAAAGIGTGTSSRNSEVIHAGIYYPPGSLKASSCVAGKNALYEFCSQAGIAHRRLGKLIVAADADELSVLDDYLRRAKRNGVNDLERLTPAEAAALEPNLRCVGAIHSPSTGIIDSHEYMLALQGELTANGGTTLFNAEVVGGEARQGRLAVKTGAEEQAVLCRTLVNCAGLQAQGLCARLGLPSALIPRRFLAKGHYYAYSGPPPFSRLVYPVAGRAGLGIHSTCDLTGQVRFGPDVIWVEALDYSFDTGAKEKFVAAVSRYFPGLEPARLRPDYTGIRPKLTPPGAAPADFRIQTQEEHGVPGLLNLFGIESPGLTASLALARRVCQLDRPR